ncbi:S-methyl-5'-thioadenosine phosphorylase, partial [Mycobacterium sp. THU-M116]
CYATIALVTDLDAGIESGDGVKTAEVFAQFQRNVEPFKKLVRAAIARVSSERNCTHCLPHTGVTLPVELP